MSKKNGKVQIGLLTTLNQLNYGGVLQAFALEKIVDFLLEERIEVINIEICPHNHLINGEPLSDLFKFWKKRNIKKYYLMFFLTKDYAKHILRRRRTLSFILNNTNRSEKVYPTPESLSKSNSYDVIIVGSDQVWNFKSSVYNFCLLNYLDGNDVKKIAYSASLGWEKLPDKYVEKFRDAIIDFQYISLREKRSIKTLEAIVPNKKIDYCVDPTILAGVDFWEKLSTSPTKYTSNYVVVYWLSSIESLEKILILLNKNGTRKIVLLASWYQLFLSSKNPYLLKKKIVELKTKYNVEWEIDAGPFEFINIFKNASFVASSSFHALMFATIFKKPFKIFVNVDGFNPMCNRIYDFCLEYFKTDKYIVDCQTTNLLDVDFSFNVNWEDVWLELDKERQKSLTFLKTSFSK